MADPIADLGPQLLVYTAILVAVPLAFVLLFRAIDYVTLDDVTERHARSSREWHVHGDRPVDENVVEQRVDDASTDRTVAGDATKAVSCPRCGTPNGSEYTFCRSCLTRIGI